MTCSSAERLIAELPGQEQREFPAPLREHLQQCRQCRALHSDLTWLVEWSARIYSLEDVPSASLARIRREVLKQIRNGNSGPNFGGWIPIPVLALSVLALFLLWPQALTLPLIPPKPPAVPELAWELTAPDSRVTPIRRVRDKSKRTVPEVHVAGIPHRRSGSPFPSDQTNSDPALGPPLVDSAGETQAGEPDQTNSPLGWW